MSQLINILIVDDSADDVEFTLAGLQGTKLANVVNTVSDGVEAMEYLRQEGKYAAAIKPSLVFAEL